MVVPMASLVPSVPHPAQEPQPRQVPRAMDDWQAVRRGENDQSNHQIASACGDLQWASWTWELLGECGRIEAVVAMKATCFWRRTRRKRMKQASLREREPPQQLPMG